MLENILRLVIYRMPKGFILSQIGIEERRLGVDLSSIRQVVREGSWEEIISAVKNFKPEAKEEEAPEEKPKRSRRSKKE